MTRTADRVKSLRGALLQALGVLGADPNAEAAARELEAEARAGKPVDPALAAASVNVVAAHGAAEDYARFAEMADHAPTPQEQLRYLYGLPLFRGARRDDPHAVRPRSTAASARRTRPSCWPSPRSTASRASWPGTSCRSRWDELNARLPPGLVIRMVEGVRFLTRPEQVAEAASRSSPTTPSRSRARGWSRCWNASA